MTEPPTPQQVARSLPPLTDAQVRKIACLLLNAGATVERVGLTPSPAPHQPEERTTMATTKKAAEAPTMSKTQLLIERAGLKGATIEELMAATGQTKQVVNSRVHTFIKDGRLERVADTKPAQYRIPKSNAKPAAKSTTTKKALESPEAMAAQAKANKSAAKPRTRSSAARKAAANKGSQA